MADSNNELPSASHPDASLPPNAAAATWDGADAEYDSHSYRQQQQQQQQHQQQHPSPSSVSMSSALVTPTTPPTPDATQTTAAAQQPREIPASKIRSSLSDLERNTTQALLRLENLRCAPPSASSSSAKGATSATAAAPQTPALAAADQQQQQQQIVSAPFLPAERRRPAEIFNFMESLLAHNADKTTAAATPAPDADAAENNTDDDDQQQQQKHDALAAENSSDLAYALPALNEVSHFALLTHTLCAYIGSMEPPRRLGHFVTKICSDTQRWLAHMFRFMDATVSYHADETDVLLHAVRLALVTRAPGWLEGGVAAAAQPCFYAAAETGGWPMAGAAAGRSGAFARLQFVCRQLGLPVASVRPIPLSGGQRIDAAALQRQIAADAAAGRTPLFAVAECGGAVSGFVDDLVRVQSVCRASGVWMHCRGHGLAAIACGKAAAAAATMDGSAAGAGAGAGGAGGAADVGVFSPVADSMALTMNAWFGIPNLPITLLHRPVHNAALAAFDMDPIVSKRLSSLSLWSTLQVLGRDAIVERLGLAFEACRRWYEIVSSFGTMRILSKPMSLEAHSELLDSENRPLNYAQLFDTVITCVVFQFNGHAIADNADAESHAAGASSSHAPPGNPFESDADHSSDSTQLLVRRSMERVANSSYFDKLNSWLAQNMQRDCPDVNLEIVEHPAFGTCMRFCPFELALGQSVPEPEQLEHAAQSLEIQIDILRATVRHRGTLQRLVLANPVLRMVTLADWAGLGGVRYVPDGWERLLTGDGREELNRLNAELVETLRSTDNAFSMGEGADGLVCVRFGMVTEDTDVEELLDLVVQVGARVQENSKVLDTMAEIVKKGIETATADLQRESEEKLWSEGILRHVPVFGQVVNWWSPPVKETGIKGRSLNLTQGVVESTENIYKYHMQLSAHDQQLPGAKCPPAPIVQTSVNAQHSRNASQGGSSTASAIDVEAAEKRAAVEADAAAVVAPPQP